MEIISVDKSNIAQEHICCAITDKKGENCVALKKAWLNERFKDGLVFKKLDVRGKVFIEYIPAKNAWAPIDAEGYMYINCLWVSGQFSGQGNANRLLAECVDDSRKKGMAGLCALSAAKKMPFLSDPKFLKHKGFKLADTAPPNYELLYLPFAEDAPVPKFRDCVTGKTDKMGMALYYTDQCPHTEKYAQIIKALANERGSDVELIKIQTTQQAQNATAPFTTYSFFYEGEFVTNEIFGEKKFVKFMDSKGIHA